MQHHNAPSVPLVRCCRWRECDVSGQCASGQPHRRDPSEPQSVVCHDHRPRVVGGVRVWDEVAADGAIVVAGQRELFETGGKA